LFASLLTTSTSSSDRQSGICLVGQPSAFCWKRESESVFFETVVVIAEHVFARLDGDRLELLHGTQVETVLNVL